VRDFLYSQRTGAIKWPHAFLSFGPFWKDTTRGRGLGIPSAILQKLIAKWIDAHEKNAVYIKATEDEQRKAKLERGKSLAAHLRQKWTDPKSLRRELSILEEGHAAGLIPDIDKEFETRFDVDADNVAWTCSEYGFPIRKEVPTIKAEVMAAWRQVRST
jgi:hypothetical protein